MLIPKTDKWVLVRWHGGGRSVLKAKYLLKFLPPGEELKISTVVKIGNKDGAPVTATVLTSGNEHRQLQILSEPGERQESPEAISPEPEVIDNDEIEDLEEEDFEESSSDWTPDSPDMDISSSDSESSDSDTSSNRKLGSSKRRQVSKKVEQEISTPMQRQRVSISSTLYKLACLNLGKRRSLSYDTRPKKRDCVTKKRRKNITKRSVLPKTDTTPKNNTQNGDSIDDLVNYMKTLFAGLFQLMHTVDPDFDCPPEMKDVKVNVLQTGDIVIMDDNYDFATIANQSSTPLPLVKNKDKTKTSEVFDKTLTASDSEDSSVSVNTVIDKQISSLFDKTLSPSESEDSSARVTKKKTFEMLEKMDISAPVNNKKISNVFKGENIRSSTPFKRRKTVDTSDEESSNSDYYSDRSDDPVLISNKYDTVKINDKEPEVMDEWIPIGSGTTLIHKDKYKKVNWKSYTIATRTLLLAAFSRRTLATHSLTGKKSPAFSHKPAKMCLDPKVVSDIVIEVGDRFKVKDNLVRSIITTKCADECKMRKMQKQKRKMAKKKEDIPPSVNDAKKKKQENVPQPGPSKNNKNQEDMLLSDEDTIESNKYQEYKPPLENNTSKGHKSRNQEFAPPSENNTLSNHNRDQENIPSPENNTAKSIHHSREYTPSPMKKSTRNKDQENIPPPESNTSKSIKNKTPEYIPLPVKDSVKNYKTYKNKSK